MAANSCVCRLLDTNVISAVGCSAVSPVSCRCVRWQGVSTHGASPLALRRAKRRRAGGTCPPGTRCGTRAGKTSASGPASGASCGRPGARAHSRAARLGPATARPRPRSPTSPVPAYLRRRSTGAVGAATARPTARSAISGWCPFSNSGWAMPPRRQCGWRCWLNTARGSLSAATPISWRPDAGNRSRRICRPFSPCWQAQVVWAHFGNIRRRIGRDSPDANPFLHGSIDLPATHWRTSLNHSRVMVSPSRRRSARAACHSGRSKYFAISTM